MAMEGFWILANIANGSSHDVEKLLNKNIINVYEWGLGTIHPKIFDQVIWGVGNLTGDTVQTIILLL